MSDLVCVDGLCLDLDKVSHIKTYDERSVVSIRNDEYKIVWKEVGQVHNKSYGYNDNSKDIRDKAFLDIQQAIKDRKGE